MNADVLATRVDDGIAVITLGSATRIYFDEEMRDALTDILMGQPVNPREGGRNGMVQEPVSGQALNREMQIAARLSSRTPESLAYIEVVVRSATDTPLAQGLALERNLFLKLCISEPALARMRSYEEKKITSPSRSVEV